MKTLVFIAVLGYFGAQAIDSATSSFAVAAEKRHAAIKGGR